MKPPLLCLNSLPNTRVQTGPTAGLLLLAATILLAPLQPANGADFTLIASDAVGASSFAAAGNWSSGAPPAPGNTYQTANFMLRTPNNAAAIAFQGDSLVIQAGGRLRDKTASTVTVANLIIDNTGILELTQPNSVNNNTAAGTFAGSITLNGTATIRAGISSDQSGETFTISSAISGSGGFTTSGSNGKIILTSANTYSGGTTLAGLAGSTLQLGNADAVSNSTVTVSLANSLTFGSGIGTFNLGGLAGTVNETLVSVSGAAVTLAVGGNNSSTTYSGVLLGAGALTKNGTGILTLNNTNSYTGVTAVNAGKLVVSSSQITTNTVSVADAATLGLTVSGTNQFQPATLELGASAGATNEFYGVNSTTIAPLRPGTLILNGTTAIRILSGNFAAGNSYPLISYTTPSGSGTLALGTLPGGVDGNLSTTGNTIYLNVTSVAPSIWSGAVNNNWDIGTTANWMVSGVSSIYADGATVNFDDSGNNTAINVAALVSPASVTVSNSAKTYSFSGGAISGAGGLTKTGNGLLVLGNTNSYASGTIVSNGTLRLGVDNALPGDVNLAGGTLDLNGCNQMVNAFSGAGMVDTIAGGTPKLTVGNNGVSSTFAGVIKNSAGTLALTKVGSGTLTLANTNSYTGQTRIEGGTLIIAGASGNSQLVLTNSNTTLRFSSNFVSGQGISISTNTADLNQTISVDTNVEATVVGLSDGVDARSTWFNGGGILCLTNATTIYNGRLRLNNLTLIIDNNASLTQTSPNAQASQIGSGAVAQGTNATGVMIVRANGQYTQTSQGLRLGCDGNGATGVLIVQDQGSVNVPLLYVPRETGNTGVVSQVGGTVTTATIQGGGGTGQWEGTYNLNGGTLAWGGGFATGPTVAGQAMHLNLNGGTLQFTAGANVMGWSAINVMSNGAVIDTMANWVSFTDALVAGDGLGGGLTKLGAGSLTLYGANTYAGSTIVSNGLLALSPSGGVTVLSNSPSIRIEPGATLDVSAFFGTFELLSGQTLLGAGSVSGAVTVDSGATLTVDGATGTAGGTLTFNDALTLHGNTVLRLDKSSTSDQLAGITTLTAGGSLTLANVGPALANGDSFTLFGAGSVSGQFLISPLTPGPGLAWDQSQLSSGIIAVTLAPAAPAIVPPLDNQTVECGANAVFTAAANGSAPLYFRWSVDGSPVGSWTTNNPNEFTLTNVHSAGSTYTVSVVVTNAVGSSSSSATLTVQDTTAPVITMLGSNPMNVVAQSTFVDPGATASDGCEGALLVTTNNFVSTSALGTYTVTYSAADSLGHYASATRTVNVILNTGVWTNQSSGLWNTAGNWLNGAIPANNVTRADFNSIDITGDVTVSLNSPRTVAGLIFGDLAGDTAAGWTLDNEGNAANVLTLNQFDGASPAVTVNALGPNKRATVSAMIAGANGMTKNGNGTLELSGANTCAGVTTVARGTLLISGNNTNIQTSFALTNSNTTLGFGSNGNYTVNSGITFAAEPGNLSETITVNEGARVLVSALTGGNAAAQSTWFNGGGTLILTNGDMTYDGRLRVNNLTLIIDKDAAFTQTGANVASSQIGSGAVPNTPTGSTGTMTVRANGRYTQTSQGLRLGCDGNGAKGVLNVQDQGSVTVPMLYLPREAGNTGVVNQVGGIVAVPEIRGGGGTATIWEGTYNLNGGTLAWGGLFANGAVWAEQRMFLNLNGGTLQFSAGAIVNGWTALNVNFNGAIIDTLTNDVTFIQALVAGDGLHGGLTKLGSGTLTLSGLNAYSGNTAVSDGTLSLSFSPGVNNISSSPVINVGAGATFDVSGVTDGFQLANAQTLSGNGTVNGAVTVAAGGTLAPGNATSIGALTFSNALTLNGNTVMKLSKSQSPSHDEVVVNGGLTFGGALIVTNLGPALALGDRFSLFSAPGTDTFATLNLPPLGSGLAWSNKLGVDGTIEVVAQAPPPQPQFSSISQSGTNLILVYGGATNQTARVLSSTDVALPIVNWTPVQTNIVGADGKFTNSIPVNPSEPQRFYRISIP